MALPLPLFWGALVGLWLRLGGSSAERHLVFWNSSNPKFQRSGGYTVEVHLNDYLDILCPHYEGSSGVPPAGSMERYTLFLVEREEFLTCRPRSKEQVRWECNRPDAAHGPERFSEKFQRFTPFTLGKEFRPGHEYYYISKPIHRHGDDCLKLRVMVAGKDARTLPSPNDPTPKGRLQSDDPDAPMLRSVGHNAAPSFPGSPFPFPGVLILLLLLTTLRLLPPLGP
nr:PREDICTED: ephrin-A1 [Anolis carolinensis]|eukprot:XP_008123674.1 PREDICTED: ephrin-A1 [Anolis carolinensis]